MAVSTISFKGKQIILVDCSKASGQSPEDVEKTLKLGSEAIARSGAKTALVITNVTDLSFNNRLSDVFKEYASRNTPYVKASVLLGLNGMQKIIFNAIKVLTKREYYLTNSMDDAKNHLANA